MGALADHLRRRIEQYGPISVAEFMAEAMGNSAFGYYRGADRLGRMGDFTTAPEISQMFGELIGLWAAVEWQAMGRPDPVFVIELGPGRGTLMADFLRAGKGVPGFVEAVHLQLIEISPGFRDSQREKFSTVGMAHPTSWHESIETVPVGPSIVIANEFFDALPIRQFIKTEKGWCERMIDIDREDNDFHFSLSAAAVDMAPFAAAPNDAPVGAVYEFCPGAFVVVEEISRRIAARGGVALLIDYGDADRGEGMGDTLQAVRHHRYHNVLSDPGEVDLTAHVDFEAIRRVAGGNDVSVYGPVTQGQFLERLGIRERLRGLLRRATPAQAIELQGGCRRLVDPLAMGRLFKVMALAEKKLRPPPGFAD